jgi:hypothetical protein
MAEHPLTPYIWSSKKPVSNQSSKLNSLTEILAALLELYINMVIQIHSIVIQVINIVT